MGNKEAEKNKRIEDPMKQNARGVKRGILNKDARTAVIKCDSVIEKSEKPEESPGRSGLNEAENWELFLIDHGMNCGQSDGETSSQKRLMIAGIEDGRVDQEWLDRATEIRAQCAADIEVGFVEEDMNRAMKYLCTDRPLNAVPNTQMTGEGGKYQVLSVAIDSGAAETVIPYQLIKSHAINPTEASRAGLNYASATGAPIPNLGEQCLPLCTREGTLRSMVFQAAPVTRALGSVKRICKSGHRVVFDEGGSYIEHKATGEVNMLREEDGNYVLDMWVLPNEAGFGGQP